MREYLEVKNKRINDLKSSEEQDLKLPIRREDLDPHSIENKLTEMNMIPESEEEHEKITEYKTPKTIKRSIRHIS